LRVVSQMAFVLLDTDVLSYLSRGDTRAQRYQRFLVGKTACISWQTVAEAYKWAEKRDWSETRRKWLETYLGEYLVLPLDRDTAWAWAIICAGREKRGRPISCSDAWIAASAIRWGCPLITHNERHFRDINCLVVNSDPQS